MGLIITLFNETIFKPLLNLLVVILDVLPGHNLGIAIVAVTLIIRFVLFPLSYKASVSQKKLMDLQPQLKELREKHKDNRETRAKAEMKFYKEHNINLFAQFVPLIIQLPILIGLYRVFLMELTTENLAANLYSFISSPPEINIIFLGFINLAVASPILAVLAGFSQFLHSKLLFSQRKNIQVSQNTKSGPDFQKMMSTQMTYIFPIIIIYIAWQFPAGLALYWVTTTVFSFVQQYVINKRI